jgi:hypothetical protein
VTPGGLCAPCMLLGIPGGADQCGPLAEASRWARANRATVEAFATWGPKVAGVLAGVMPALGPSLSVVAAFLAYLLAGCNTARAAGTLARLELPMARAWRSACRQFGACGPIGTLFETLVPMLERAAALEGTATTTTATTNGGTMLPGRIGTTADLELVRAIWPALAAYIDNGTPLRVPPLAAAGSPQADVVRAIVKAIADDEARTHPKGQPSQLSSEARARVERVRSLLDQSRQWPRATGTTASIPAPTARSLTARVAWSPSGVTSTGGIAAARGITGGSLSGVTLPPVPASQAAAPAAAGGGLALGALALVALSVLR